MTPQDQIRFELPLTPSAWFISFSDPHDYSRTGKHDPLNCRHCLQSAYASLEAEYQKLKEEKNRGVSFCSFCGWTEEYDNTDPGAQSHAAAMLAVHVRGCKEHPLVKRAEAAEASLTQLQAENQKMREEAESVKLDKLFWNLATNDERLDVAREALEAAESALTQQRSQIRQVIERMRASASELERIGQTDGGMDYTYWECEVEAVRKWADELSALLQAGDPQ